MPLISFVGTGAYKKVRFLVGIFCINIPLAVAPPLAVAGTDAPEPPRIYN